LNKEQEQDKEEVVKKQEEGIEKTRKGYHKSY